MTFVLETTAELTHGGDANGIEIDIAHFTPFQAPGISIYVIIFYIQ